MKLPRVANKIAETRENLTSRISQKFLGGGVLKNLKTQEGVFWKFSKSERGISAIPLALPTPGYN